MKLKEGLVLREVTGEFVVINTGDAMDLDRMYKVNETGKLLWECLEQEMNTDAMVQALMAEYEVDAALANEAVNAFIAQLKKNDFIEE